MIVSSFLRSGEEGRRLWDYGDVKAELRFAGSGDSFPGQVTMWE